MIHPHIAPYLPPEVWSALQRITTHIEALPLTDDAKRFIQKDVEHLAERLVLASKQHHLHFPIGG